MILVPKRALRIMILVTSSCQAHSNLVTKQRSYAGERVPYSEKIIELLSEARAGHSARVKELIQEGLAVSSVDSTGSSCLHYAAHYLDTPLLKFLLERGAQVNQATNLGKTPLHRAILTANSLQSGSAEKLMRHLLQAGARYDISDSAGNTALDYALRGSSNLVEILLEYTMAQPIPKQTAHRASADEAQHASTTQTSRLPVHDPDESLYSNEEKESLYKYLEQGNMDGVTRHLTSKAVRTIANDRNAIREASIFFEQALPGLDEVLEVCLPYLGKYTYIQKICSIDMLRGPLLTVFFYELHRGILICNEQALEARSYALAYLRASLNALLKSLLNVISKERPSLLDASGLLISAGKALELNEEVILKELTRDQVSSATPPRISLFERIGNLERHYLRRKQELKRKRTAEPNSPDVFSSPS